VKFPLESASAMKVTGKPVATSVGVFFIAFAAVCAVLLLPGARHAQSPALYISLLGGIFIGLPGVLGIAIVLENFRNRE
jgi:hypothetical protein